MPPIGAGARAPTTGGAVPLLWWYHPNWPDRAGGAELASGGEK